MRHMILSLLFLVACTPSDPDDGRAVSPLASNWMQPTAGFNWRIGFNVVNPSAPGSGPCCGKPLS